MHLTRFTDLSLRVLLYLGYINGERLATVNEISSRIRWSQNHIVKVVHRLSKLGILASVRGRAGGVRLAQPAAEYHMGDILRELEGRESMIDCEHPPCAVQPSCPLIQAVNEAQEAFFERLNAFTLADLLQHSALSENYKSIVPPVREQRIWRRSILIRRLDPAPHPAAEASAAAQAPSPIEEDEIGPLDFEEADELGADREGLGGEFGKAPGWRTFRKAPALEEN